MENKKKPDLKNTKIKNKKDSIITPNLVFKKSAILILIHSTNNERKIILTARSSKLKNHSGEICFPGGVYDSILDETLKDTALRETEEEIGILRSKIEIIGKLEDVPTLSKYIISPFIGKIKNFQSEDFLLNFDEVKQIIQIPIKYLYEKKIFTETIIKRNEKKIYLLSFDYINPNTHEKHHIWGATAHIISDFMLKINNIQVTSDEYYRLNISDIRNI